jgi:ComF family protein
VYPADESDPDGVGALDALRRLPSALLEALAPQRCIYCDQSSGSALPLCRVCEGELLFNTAPCPRCALPGCGGNLCPACQARPPALSSVTATLVYDRALAYLMHRWKYGKERRLADIGAYFLSKNSDFLEKVDIVLVTPLHWRRLLQRGFNQSEDLLTALQRSDSGFRHARTRSVRLQRVRATAAQAASTRDARLRNLRGAFRVRGDVRGLSVGLIDDVCTTGATANAMASALRDAGAAQIHLLCIARTPDR